ncbi:MAG: putative nucleic-acid-binding protein implicated in transcription termination [Firmicutes bacterium]|nr:putative nucleic-acid-binding protein implicated in transcription termination [Bacillota bacterium]MDI6704718.1 YlxR family protein [Bacillota bacterium]
MRIKKIPNRLCLGCQQMKPKRELVRVVKSKEGDVSLDKTGKKPGRGAYICPHLDCLAKARKTKRIEKSLGIRIDEHIFDQLEEELKNGG